MKPLIKYLYIFKIAVIQGLEYRMNFILGLVSALFPILIQFFLWKAVFQISGESRQFGYDYDGIVSYVILAGFVAKFVACGFEWEISKDIKEGKLNNYIIKPIGYMNYQLWNFFGGKSIQLVILTLVFTVLGFLQPSIHKVLHLQNIMLFVLSLFLAMLMNFLIYYCVATIAFWLQEIWGIFIIVNLIFTFVCGGIFPLDVLGKTFMDIVKWLPFQYIIYFPVRLLIGQIPDSLILEGLIIPLIWITLLYIISKLMWRRGMKSYISVGG